MKLLSAILLTEDDREFETELIKVFNMASSFIQLEQRQEVLKTISIGKSVTESEIISVIDVVNNIKTHLRDIFTKNEKLPIRAVVEVNSIIQTNLNNIDEIYLKLLDIKIQFSRHTVFGAINNGKLF